MNGSLAVTKKKVHIAIYNDGSLAEMKKKVHTVINNEWLTCCNEEKGPHSYNIYNEWLTC